MYKYLKSIIIFFLALSTNYNALAGSVSRYCPTKVLICSNSNECKSEKIQIRTEVNAFFGINNSVQSLNFEVESTELEQAYGKFENPIVKQKLGFVILENKKYYIAIPLQKSKGLYLKEKSSSLVLAPGEKESGSDWNLICKG